MKCVGNRTLPTLVGWFTTMSGERVTLSSAGNGVLRGSRSKSYGSLVGSPLSPVRQRRIEHKLQPGETLQGLALKYGVSVSTNQLDCKCNKLWTLTSNCWVHFISLFSLSLLSKVSPITKIIYRWIDNIFFYNPNIKFFIDLIRYLCESVIVSFVFCCCCASLIIQL